MRGFTENEAVSCKVALLQVAVGREHPVWMVWPFCVVPSDKYKIILGLDFLEKSEGITLHAEHAILFGKLPNRNEPLKIR